MASSFKITLHRRRDSLHLKLTGDFDGNSAWELYNLMENNSKYFHKIIIDTNCLNEIIPFGVHTFHQILSDLRKDRIRLLFTGKKADQISPEKDLCCYPGRFAIQESRMSQSQEI